MKKIIYLIFTITIFFSLTACKKKCKNIEYDNECDAICNICEEERQVQSHQWIDATCTSPQSCKDCGYIEVKALGHNIVYCEYQDSTCTESGIKECWHCTRCLKYFNDEEGTQIVDYADVVIHKKAHSDENKDHTCDYGCSETIGTHVDSNTDNDNDTNTWTFKFKNANEFKSITLTHTGECDDCKAN